MSYVTNKLALVLCRCFACDNPAPLLALRAIKFRPAPFRDKNISCECPLCIIRLSITTERPCESIPRGNLVKAGQRFRALGSLFSSYHIPPALA
ncbi:hypothetical protein C8Q74DRAFT_176308 [Fomes fomentarius]|nr:hypothetical protein C8Q74DRAFT_176308 [Fomes fomentarius]